MTLLGFKQEEIIKLGKRKGSVSSSDAAKLWSKKGVMMERMNSLIILGYFSKPKDDGVKIIWEYVKK